MKQFRALVMILLFLGLCFTVYSQDVKVKEFIIVDSAFNDSTNGELQLEYFTENDVLMRRVPKGETIKIHDGKAIYFGYGATHKWIRKCLKSGYTFESDEDDTLVFKVIKDKGYVHIKGKGKITKPDGTIIKLPL